MALHFLHIGKTGGTAIKQTLKSAAPVDTPYGPLKLHRHRYKLAQVPEDHYAFFVVRDPIARFVSGYHSRLNKGRPRYEFEWREEERIAFEAFPTAQQLAVALVSRDEEERKLAEWSMRHIQHLGFMQRKLGTPKEIRPRLDRILYIGRQETLDRDWPRMKSELGLPQDLELPTDPTRAHRRQIGVRDTLDDDAIAALRKWYARDYRLLTFFDEVRAERGWGTPPDGSTGDVLEPPRRPLESLRRLFR